MCAGGRGRSSNMRSILSFSWELLEHGLSHTSLLHSQMHSQMLVLNIFAQEHTNLFCAQKNSASSDPCVVQFSWAIIEERHKLGYMQDTNYFMQAPFPSG
jgi:hypothetical protein